MRLYLMLAFLSASVFALNTTTELSANYSVAQTLVSVHANLSFDVLVPGLSYERPIVVAWDLPYEALDDVQNDSLTIHVFAFSDEGSWAVFQKGNQTFKALAFDLTCILENQTCANASNLEQTLTAVIVVPENANASHTERVRIQASLAQMYISVPANEGKLEQVTRQIKDVVGQLPVDVVISGVQALKESAEKVVSPDAKETNRQPINDEIVSATTTPLSTTTVQVAAIKPQQSSNSQEQTQEFASTVSGLLSALPQESGFGILALLAIAGFIVLRKRKPKHPHGIFEA